MKFPMQFGEFRNSGADVSLECGGLAPLSYRAERGRFKIMLRTPCAEKAAPGRRTPRRRPN